MLKGDSSGAQVLGDLGITFCKIYNGLWWHKEFKIEVQRTKELALKLVDHGTFWCIH